MAAAKSEKKELTAEQKGKELEDFKNKEIKPLDEDDIAILTAYGSGQSNGQTALLKSSVLLSRSTQFCL